MRNAGHAQRSFSLSTPIQSRQTPLGGNYTSRRAVNTAIAIALSLSCYCFAQREARAESGLMRIAAGASFHELGLSTNGDAFTITNVSQLDANLFRAVIDTSSSDMNAFFHVYGAGSSPFVADSLSAAQTGFVGFRGGAEGSRQISLEFTDFDPGETFSFRIDVDNRTGWYTPGSAFAGTRLTTLFQQAGLTHELFGAYAAQSNSMDWAHASLSGMVAAPDFTNPEPSSFLLALIGGTALGGFVWRTRRR